VKTEIICKEVTLETQTKEAVNHYETQNKPSDDVNAEIRPIQNAVIAEAQNRDSLNEEVSSPGYAF